MCPPNLRIFLKCLELIGKVYKKKELHSEAEEEPQSSFGLMFKAVDFSAG